jgi:hypothetical protein
VAGVKQTVQIVHNKGVTVADEQVVVPVLELLRAFLQCTVPCGISFKFKKLIALQIPKYQCLVSTIQAFSTSMLHTVMSHREKHKPQGTNLITVYLNIACNSSECKVVN